MRAPQCRDGTCVTDRLPWREVFHQSSSMISEKPRSDTKSVTWLGNDDGGALASRAQIILHDRAQRRPVKMIEMGVRNQHQIDRRQIAHAKPGRRKRFSTNSQRAKLGSIMTLCRQFARRSWRGR